MSKEKYMVIDLLLMGAILCVLEFASAAAIGFFPGEVYTLSCMLPITLISMMRWGKWGLVHAILGGAVYSILYGGSIATLLVYTIGNAGTGLSLILFKLYGKEKIRSKKSLTILYCLMAFLGVSLLRGIIACVLSGGMIIDNCIRFLTTDALSALIAVVAVFIAKAQNGLFEDQLSYLIRLKKEEAISGKQ